MHSSIADFGLLFDLHNASEDKGGTENLHTQKNCHALHEHWRTNTGMPCTTHANKHGQRCQS